MKPFFFYGSLMSGYWNHQRIIPKECKQIGGVTVVPGFTLWLGARGIVPCACPSDNPDDKLYGELWSVDGVTAAIIDSLEKGYDYMELTSVGYGLPKSAGIYYCKTPEECSYVGVGAVQIKSGNYRDAVEAATRRRLV